MNKTILAAVLISAGAALMAYSVVLGRLSRAQVSDVLQPWWSKITGLMGFALLGYLLFVVTLFGYFSLSFKILTALVLLGGAVFVNRLVRLARGCFISAADKKERLEKERAARELIPRDRTRRRTAELDTQNKLLENIIAHIPSIVFWKDAESVYQGCNPGFLRLCGASTSREVVGRRDRDLAWPPEFCAALQEIEEKVLRTGEAVLDQEMTCRDGRGGELTCLNSWIPLKAGSGAPEGVLGIFKDISARKRTENALQRVNRSLETLSSGSAAVVRATTEEQLLGQVCRIIVQAGQYAQAWAVTLAEDAASHFRCATGHGSLQNICQVPLEDDALPARTIQSGEVCVEPGFQPVAGMEKGTLLALPLFLGGESRGALVIYAGQSDRFEEEEIQLLTDLAGHLAHGISALREAQLRQEAEKAVADERRFLQTVIDGVVDPIMVIGIDYRVLLLNRAARSFLPETHSRTEALYCYQVYHRRTEPCPAENGPCPVIEVPRTGEAMTLLHSHTFDEGGCRVFEMEASPLWRADGLLEGVIESSRDITERLQVEESLRRNKERLDHLAHHDALTGLPNRLLFHDRLGHAIARAAREDQRAALLFLDLDRFKTINDTLGHENGDQVLREVAGRLQSILRSADTVARLGGDEFVVLVECCGDLSEAAGVARKIIEVMAEGMRIGEQDLHLTTSIGISLYPDDAQDREGLLKFADQAMYRAKDEGRNTYQFFRPEMNKRSNELLALESSLRKALAEEQLSVVYQPQYDLATRRLIGFEALMRWNHPTRGMISPAEFIPLAEESGLIVSMGDWILRTVCAQNKAWQQEGLPAVRMAVNISARQFRQPDFVDLVENALADAGLEADWLELEITESIAMQNVEETIMTLTDLKIRGIHLAIDDFGTGYSSLNYLKRFPISKLKIDQSFVRDIAGDPHDAAIVGAVIALGHSLNLEVIAEGVETEAQMHFLLERGCRQAQGYLFSPPRPAPECRELLAACGPRFAAH